MQNIVPSLENGAAVAAMNGTIVIDISLSLQTFENWEMESTKNVSIIKYQVHKENILKGTPMAKQEDVAKAMKRPKGKQIT